MSFVDNNLSQWVDSNLLQWPADFKEIRQIWNDDYYVYAATAEGLDIIEIDSEQQYAYITYSGGFNSVWANDNNVYVATSDAGIKYINKTTITGSIITPLDLINDLMNYAGYPTITSDYVRYIHGQDNLLMCCTDSGVNTLGVYGKDSMTLTPYAQKCFLSEEERLYYITASGGVYALNRVNTPVDWTIPNKIYNVGDVVFRSGITLNDIFVDGVTIYTATSSGIYAIDDDTENFSIYFVGA